MTTLTWEQGTYCFERPEQQVILHPEVVIAHEQQLQRIANEFTALGWSSFKTIIHVKCNDRSSYLLGHLWFTDGVNDIRVNYNFRMGVDGKTESVCAMQARPACPLAGQSQKPMRIISHAMKPFEDLSTHLAQSPDVARGVLRSAGYFDIDTMLPATRLKRIVTFLDP